MDLRFGSRSIAKATLLVLLTLSIHSMKAESVSAQSSEWPHYGRDAGASRYSPISQVNRKNVENLEIAWTYHTGDNGEGHASRSHRAFEATPVLVDGTMYVSTPYNLVIALDPADGHEKWRFDPELDKSAHYFAPVSRGVSVWTDAAATEGSKCRQTVFMGTLDGRLMGLDAATGQPCSEFGVRGFVDLLKGVNPKSPASYSVTSPPVLTDDLVIVGSAVADFRGVEVELGIVRAFDARTGALRWSWDPVPRDPSEPAWATWGEDGPGKASASNAWTMLAVDVERDIVFIPTSAPGSSQYGGHRPGKNLYSSSLVALRASTGEMIWYQQLTHHDVFDADLLAQPILVDIERNGERIPAVIQTNRAALVFTFNRETGEPIFEVEERPVPGGGVPGEHLWPTQPFPVAPPPLVSHAPLTPDDAWGLTPWDRSKCRELIENSYTPGVYSPPSLQGTIMNPGMGGMNWGGASFDPERQLLIANVMVNPARIRLIPDEEAASLGTVDWKKQAGRDSGGEDSALPIEGTPYSSQVSLPLSPFGVPCTPPPWGELVAVDMKYGRIVWRKPLGTIEDLAPFFVPNLRLGVPNHGGSIVTGGGLAFIGAAMDDYLRAFDVDTGEELWKGRLPAGGQATPMTYMVDGRQFVVIAAGGHGFMGTTMGDAVVAFALPRD